MTDVQQAARHRGEELAGERFQRFAFEILARHHSSRFGGLDLAADDAATLGAVWPYAAVWRCVAVTARVAASAGNARPRGGWPALPPTGRGRSGAAASPVAGPAHAPRGAISGAGS